MWWLQMPKIETVEPSITITLSLVEARRLMAAIDRDADGRNNYHLVNMLSQVKEWVEAAVDEVPSI